MSYWEHAILSLYISTHSYEHTRGDWLDDAASYMVKFWHYNITEVIQ